ncbi:hypothetical protein [Actinokineospora sp.]|uniref:hypothetical protein n=1 Tax=Actinokineospora sp. TaxID=1872133 RepID=UPI0040376F31
MSGFRGLGVDPTPGDPDSVVAAAAEYSTAAEALGQVDSALRRVGEATESWGGPAADSFAARLAALPPDLDERATTLRRAAEVLATWAQTLAGNKRTADELDAAAVALRKRISAAQDDLHDKRNALDLAATPVTAATAGIDHAAAEAALTGLETRLDEVLGRARALADDHQRAADAVADELAALSRGDLAQPDRSGQDLVRSVGGFLNRASAMSSALAGLLAPPPTGVPIPRGGAAAAVTAMASGGGHDQELVIFGETPLTGPSRR